MAKRQEQTRETINRILDAATFSFSERGYEGCSIADIADKTGMSQGSLYVHFTNKEALFKAIILREFRRAADQIAEVAKTGVTRDRLIDLIMHFVIDNTYPFDHRLWLEISALAARDPALRVTLSEGDRIFQEALAVLLRKATWKAGAGHGHHIGHMALWLSIFLGGLVTRVALGIIDDPKEQRRVIVDFVDMILAAPTGSSVS